MTPLAAAKDLIRPYVLRGEPLDSLAASCLGAANERYRAMIEHDRTISVVVVGGDGVKRGVPLREAYTAVCDERDETPVQIDLFSFPNDERARPLSLTRDRP